MFVKKEGLNKVPKARVKWMLTNLKEVLEVIRSFREGVTKKKEKIWDNVPIRVDPTPPSDIWDIFEFQFITLPNN